MKMRHFLAIFFYAIILGWQPGSVKVQALRTPELFGDANALMFYTDHEVRGIIFNSYFGGTLTGSVNGNEVACQIKQISGEPVKGIDQSVPCYGIVKEEKWVGWIDFRGHHRKMCGAQTLESLPAICRLEK